MNHIKKQLPELKENFLLQIIILGTITFFCLKIYLLFSGKEAIVSDLDVYEQWSKDILSNKEPHHLPLFPILVSLLSNLTLGIIDTLLIMQLIAISAWVFLCIEFNNILKILVDKKYVNHALALFAFYPFFGFSFTLYPAPDKLAHLAVASLLLGYLINSKNRIIVAASMGLLIHKAMWPYLIIGSVACFVFKKINLIHLIIIFLPLSAYYLFVNINNAQAEINILINLATDFGMQNGFSIPFQELINGLIFSGLVDTTKSLFLLTVTFVAIYLLILNIAKLNILNIFILIPILLIGAFIVEFVLTGYLRHSIYIVLPIFTTSGFLLVQKFLLRINIYVTVFALLITQIMFSLIIFD